MKNYNYIIKKNVYLKRLLFISAITSVSFVTPFLAKLAIRGIDIPLSYPYNSVILTGIFYLLQLGIGLFFLYLLTGKTYHDLFQKMRFEGKNIMWLIPFLTVWLVLVVIFYWFALSFFENFPSYIVSWWKPDVVEFKKDLLTTCLQAGLFEELFFKGVIACMLMTSFDRPYSLLTFKKKFFLIGYNGLIFSISHIEYAFNPWRVLPLDFIQLFVTFVVGCVLTYKFYKTTSILGPIFAHTGANIIQVLVGYYCSFYLMS